MSLQTRRGFWKEALSVHEAVTGRVCLRVLVIGLLAAAICVLTWVIETRYWRTLTLEVAPHEFAGAALGLLLVLRTNAGYERWWEARKLWGGFVDRCRNVMISALAYGPNDARWRMEFTRRVAAYPHVARHSLRGERPALEVAALLGDELTQQVASAHHMPSFVALELADLLSEARTGFELDGFSFLQIDRERALLIESYGGCERILNTPLPRAYSVTIRHFIMLYLLTLPFVLLHRMEGEWLVPLVTMLVAYPLLALDQVGVELENPFSTRNLSFLPIDGLSAFIERNTLELHKSRQATSV